MEKDVTVGLDVHARKTAYVMQDETGAVLSRGELATTEAAFEAWVRAKSVPDGTRVGLESGTQAFLVARWLRGLGLEPRVIDAHEVRCKTHRKSQKSDSRDAFEICDGLRRDIYRAYVHVPPPEVEALRAALMQRRHFVRLQTLEVNAAKYVLRAAGLEVHGRRSLKTQRGWDRLLGQLDACAPQQAEAVRAHLAVWQAATAQVAALDKRLQDLTRGFRDRIALLREIPGVGFVIAATIVAVLSDVERFADSKHVASYAGLVPRTYNSGERQLHGRISKRGNPELRAMLCQAAQKARQPGNPFHPYYRKLCAKRGHKIAVIAVASRILRVAWTMLRDGESFSLARLGVEAGPFERSTTDRYRLKPSGRSAGSAGAAREAQAPSTKAPAAAAQQPVC